MAIEAASELVMTTAQADMDGLTIFLCGDVMTGRGVDQILPHPGDPTLREPVVDDARTLSLIHI